MAWAVCGMIMAVYPRGCGGMGRLWEAMIAIVRNIDHPHRRRRQRLPRPPPHRRHPRNEKGGVVAVVIIISMDQ